jgi:hypothetical protein
LALSVPGGGGVILSDPGHAGVLFSLRSTSKRLSGGIPDLPPEQSTCQYPLKSGSCGYFFKWGGGYREEIGRERVRSQSRAEKS